MGSLTDGLRAGCHALYDLWSFGWIVSGVFLLDFWVEDMPGCKQYQC
jgi:hypothetical protein